MLEELFKGINGPALLTTGVAVVSAVLVLWASLRGHRVTENKNNADSATGKLRSIHDGFDLLIKELQEERHELQKERQELKTLIKDQTVTIKDQSAKLDEQGAELKRQHVTIEAQNERLVQQNEQLKSNRGTIQEMRKTIDGLDGKVNALSAYLVEVLAVIRAAGQEPPPPPESVRGNNG